MLERVNNKFILKLQLKNILVLQCCNRISAAMVEPDIKVCPQLFYIHHIINGDGETFLMPVLCISTSERMLAHVFALLKTIEYIKKS